MVEPFAVARLSINFMEVQCVLLKKRLGLVIAVIASFGRK